MYTRMILLFHVKIRPLWDGNKFWRDRLAAISYSLKSDHCGMEMLEGETFKLTLQLKSDHCGMEIDCNVLKSLNSTC